MKTVVIPLGVVSVFKLFLKYVFMCNCLKLYKLWSAMSVLRTFISVIETGRLAANGFVISFL